MRKSFLKSTALVLSLSLCLGTVHPIMAEEVSSNIETALEEQSINSEDNRGQNVQEETSDDQTETNQVQIQESGIEGPEEDSGEIEETPEAEAVEEDESIVKDPQGQNNDADTQMHSNGADIAIAEPDTGTEEAKRVDEVQYTMDKTSFTYSGEEIKPAVTNVRVRSGDTWIDIPSGQYTIAYTNNINAGTGNVAVTVSLDSSTGTGNKAFTIVKANQKPQFIKAKKKVKYGTKGKFNIKNAYGKVTFKSSNPKVLKVTKGGTYKAKSTGTAKITVTTAGNKNYNTGTVKIKVTVTGKSLKGSKTKIKLSKNKYLYNGKKRKPSVTVKYRGKKLKRGRDYKVVYENNINAGKAIVTVKGIGKYSDAKRKAFKIQKASNTMKAVLKNKDIDVNKRAKIKVTKNIGKMTYTSDKPAIATVSTKGVITGKSMGECVITAKAAGDKNHKAKAKRFRILVGYKSIKSSNCKISLSQKDFTYDGTPKCPTITIKYKGKKLIQDTDYTIIYQNNTNAGKATAIITGKGKFIDSRKIDFTINKADQTSFSVSPIDTTVAKGGTLTLTTSGATGDVVYRSNSPTYLVPITTGQFRADKTTKDYVTITVTANGDANHNSKSVTVVVKIQ